MVSTSGSSGMRNQCTANQQQDKPTVALRRQCLPCKIKGYMARLSAKTPAFRKVFGAPDGELCANLSGRAALAVTMIRDTERELQVETRQDSGGGRRAVGR